MRGAVLLLALPVAALGAQRPATSITVDGTVCRMSRSAGRMIVATDDGPRLRVVLGNGTPITFDAHPYDRGDLRPGDRVHVVAARGEGSHLDARRLDITMRVDQALLDSFLGSRRKIVGRFAVREAKTEFFSLNLPGDSYVRVDGKAAYGSNGRVWVNSLKPGDLLEIRGNWVSKDLLQASSINVITDIEPSFCSSHARRGETSMGTTARENDERMFLDGRDSDQ